MLTTTPVYSANLAALATFQPEVAGVVDAVGIPADVRPVEGRDGSDTLVIPGEDGGPVFFGGSSMPSVSAAEMFAGFVSDGRNVSLPGVLTGFDPLVVVGKMAPHTALFVIEEHAWHVKLALHLYDYAELIAGGRIVFIVGDDPEGKMYEFFESHAGYGPPTRLLTPPQRSPAQMAELQRRLENAGEAVQSVGQRFVEASAEHISTRSFASLPATPRVAVLSFDVRPASVEQAHRIQRALAKLGWPHVVCVPDSPSRCHVAAHLQAIDRLSADLVLVINGSGGPIASLLPTGLPVGSWYLPGAGPAAGAGSPAHHAVFTLLRPDAAGSDAPDASSAEGAKGGVCSYCEPAADDTAYFPLDPSRRGDSQRSLDVAILMDLPDDRAEACEVTLPSHVLFWKALGEVVSKNIDRYTEGQADEFVERAQRASGVTLEDEGIRGHFANLVRSRIAPACRGRAAAHAVATTGCRFAAWGLNWQSALPGGHDLETPGGPSLQRWGTQSGDANHSPTSKDTGHPDGSATEPRAEWNPDLSGARAKMQSQEGAPNAHGHTDDWEVVRGVIPVGKQLNELFNATRIVVLPDFSATALQTALDALAAGVRVVCHAPDEPFEKTHPDLQPVARYLHLYRTRRELADTLGRLTSQRDNTTDETTSARAVVLAEHCVSHRLQLIADHVRAHEPSAIPAAPPN